MSAETGPNARRKPSPADAAPEPQRDAPPVERARRPAPRRRERDATLRILEEQRLAGICILRHDGTIAFANACFADLLHRTVEEIVGGNLVDFVPATEYDRLRSHLRARSAGAEGVNQFTTMTVGGDGSAREVLVRTTRTTYQGKPASLAVVLDVTGVWQVGDGLKFANVIIEQSPVVVFQASAQAGLRHEYISNNVSRFGYTADEVYAGAFRFPDYVHAEDRPAALAAMRAMIEGKTDRFEHDYRLVTRDGSLRWVQDRTVAVREDGGTVCGYRGTLIDITERVEAERALRRTNRALRLHSDLTAVAARATSETELLQDVCRILVQDDGYRLAWIALAENGAGDSPHMVASYGGTREHVAALHLAWMRSDRDWGLEGRALRTGQPQVAPVPATDPAMAPWREECPACGLGSSAALPLGQNGHVYGALVVVSRQVDAFDNQELALLGDLARRISFGVRSVRAHAEHDRLQRRLMRGLSDTVHALASALEMRDPYTAGHQKAAARLVIEIARIMGLPDNEVEGIALAASLHDIGKIQVPMELAAKPGRLTPPELRLVQTHVQAGYEILKAIDFPWRVADMVLQHHERLDGSGYPNGLKGDAILLGARIIAVADVVEAMMSHRPYRPALGRQAAMAELANGRGRLYDSAAVDACIALSRRPDFTRLVFEDDSGSHTLADLTTALGQQGEMRDGPSSRLTLQQSAVILLLADGLTTKEIARRLDLSVSTVKAQLSRAYQTLGARNRVDAVMRAAVYAEHTLLTAC